MMDLKANNISFLSKVLTFLPEKDQGGGGLCMKCKKVWNSVYGKYSLGKNEKIVT